MRKTNVSIYLSLVLLTFLSSLLIATGKGLYPLIVLLGLLFSLLTFANPEIGIHIIVFSMLFSPELKLTEVPGRAVVLRFDDVFLGVIFISWLVHTAIFKKLGLLKSTPINKNIYYYLGVYIISTGIGVLENIVLFKKAFFYILKFVEYFLLFFMVSNFVSVKEHVKRVLISVSFVFVLVVVYGYTQVGFGRVSCPFDVGEPSTFGAYVILLMGLFLGMLMYAPSLFWRAIFLLLFLFPIKPLLYSYSRASYLAFFPMTAFPVIFSKKKSFIVIAVYILSILLLLKLLPESVKQRVKETFITDPQTGHVTFEESSQARINKWREVLFYHFPKRPLLGWGVTGVGFIDSQYFRILGETGLVGVVVFLWLLYAIYRSLFKNLSIVNEWWEKGFLLGLLSGYTGLLFHALTSNTFIIVRVMEPFWLLVALGMMLPGLSPEVANADKGLH